MKRRIGPVLSLLLLLGLATYVYVYEIRGKAGVETSDAAKDKPIPFDRASLKAIRLQNEHGVVRLEKQGEAWKVTEPLAAEADKEAVEGLLNSLDTAHIDRRLGAKPDRKSFGLEPPKATLAIEKTSGEPWTLLIGDGSPIGGTYYAQLPGTQEVAVVGSSIGDFTRKDLFSLRDKSLLSLDPWKVNRLTLERGLETIKMEKPDDGWVVRQPVEAPADGPTITDLLNALENLRATAFDSEKPSAADLKRFGLDPPQARLTLMQEGWDVEKTVVLGKEATGGGRYARTIGRDPVLTVPADFWTKATTKFFDLRRKDVLAVQQYRVESIHLTRAGLPSLDMTRQKDQSWVVSGGATGNLKSESVDALLRMISDLKAQAFDDNPTESVRQGVKHGPALDLTLVEEADTSAGKQKSQHLLVSPPDKAHHVLVLDLAWRPVAVASADVLSKIQTQVDALVKETVEAPKTEPSPAPAASPSPGPSATP